jgi:hypothetical protein
MDTTAISVRSSAFNAGQRRGAGHSLIGSDKVDGGAVYGADEKEIGPVERLMIDKVSGKVAYAVISYGAFMGTVALAQRFGIDAYDPRDIGFRNAVGDQCLDLPTQGQVGLVGAAAHPEPAAPPQPLQNSDRPTPRGALAREGLPALTRNVDVMRYQFDSMAGTARAMFKAGALLRRDLPQR